MCIEKPEQVGCPRKLVLEALVFGLPAPAARTVKGGAKLRRNHEAAPTAVLRARMLKATVCEATL